MPTERGRRPLELWSQGIRLPVVVAEAGHSHPDAFLAGWVACRSLIASGYGLATCNASCDPSVRLWCESGVPRRTAGAPGPPHHL